MLSKKESKKFVKSNINLSKLDGTVLSMRKYGITKLNLVDKKLISSVVKNVANKKFLKIFKDVVEDDIDINQTIKILEQDLIAKKDYIDVDEFVKFRNQLKKIKDLLSKKYNYEKIEKNKNEKKKKELEEILFFLRQEKEKEDNKEKEETETKGKNR